MPDDTFSAMRQSIIDGAPDTACSLAQQAITAGTAPLDAINHGFRRSDARRHVGARP